MLTLHTNHPQRFVPRGLPAWVSLARPSLACSLLACLLLACLLSACSNDAATEEQPSLIPFTIDVVEASWQGGSDWTEESFSVSTRAGETINGLKAIANENAPADGEGFGIFGLSLLGPTSQRQVTWNNTKGQWNMGDFIYWMHTNSYDTFDVYAYAPYNSSFSVDAEVATSGLYTFTADATDGQNIDLLYAGATVKRSDGLAQLTFRHALAKLSFGTITNNTGVPITLTKVDIKGSFYKSGKLELKSGTWSNQERFKESDPAVEVDKTYSRNDFNPTTADDQPLVLNNNDVEPLNIAPVLLIPNAPVSPATLGTIGATITLTFEGGDTYDFDIKLHQGKNQTYNITVNKNFEVVIE